MARLGRLFVVSAPSGTGKTTLVRKILKEVPGCVRSISVTTRKPRSGEADGVDYRFVSEGAFREMVDRGDLFEWEEVHDHCYGTPRAPLEARRREGRDILLDIDTRGALSIKRSYPDSCLIFLAPPSEAALEQRLRARKTEGEVSLRKRLEAARLEMAEKKRFDYVILNDDLEQAFREVRKIIEAKRAVGDLPAGRHGVSPQKQ